MNELFDTHFEQAGRIEVVRGPGSAFYGSNSLTGSINVLLPHDGPSSLSVELGENDYRRLKLSGGYSQPQARGTFYLTSTDTSSFREESGYEQHKLSWRESRQLGDWQLASGLTVTYLDQETAGFINGADSYLDLDLARLNANPEAFRETQSFRAWTTLSKEISDGREIRITPYVRQTEMDFLLHFLPGAPLEENEQSGFGWQASYRVQASSELTWAVGLDADFSSGELRQSQDAPTQGSNFLVETVPTGLHYDYQVDAQQIAVFGHLDWSINDSLSLLAGIRGEVLEYDYDNRALDGRTRDDGSECGFGGCRYSRPADREDSFSNISPKLELRYELNDRLRFYTALSSAFRAPQATELYRLQGDQQVADLENVEAINIELGLVFRSEQFNASASLYHLEQDNIIIRDSDSFNIDGNQVESLGLEVALNGAVLKSVDWRVAGTFAEHEYSSDQFSGGININGNLVDTAPKRQINAALVWRPIEAISTELEWVHVSEYFLDPENLRTYPGHDVLNLRAQYQVSEKVSIFGRILNITDERFAERADFTTFTDERYFPGAPRAVFAGFRYDFSAKQP